MGEHSNAVAEFKHEIRTRQDIGVATTDLDKNGRLVPRQVEITQGSAHHRWAGSKHTQIVEVAAILDEVTGRGFSEDRARLRERLLRGSDGEQNVIFSDDNVGRCRLVTALPTQRGNLHSGR